MAIGEMLGNLAGRAVGGNVGILDKVTEQITALAKAGEKTMESIRGLTDSLTKLLLGPLKNVQAIGQSIAPFVALFNPAIVIQFELALRDTMAVMGQMLVPVLQGVTNFVRKFGDALVGLTPVFQPLFDEIGQFISSFAAGLVPMIKAAAPLLEALSDALASFLRILAQGIAFVVGAVTQLLNIITSLFGLTSRFKEGSSTNFAFRPTRVQGVRQFAESVFESSARNIYSRGTSSKKPEELLAEIKAAMAAGKAVIDKIAGFVEEVAKWVRNPYVSIRKAIEGAVDAADSFIGQQFAKFGLSKPW